LLKYYDGDDKLLDNSPTWPAEEDMFLASKMAMTILGLKDPGGKSFTIAALGSSVTAGHGTFSDAAWPAVLERHLQPLWSAFGVRFSVRNHAQGSQPPDLWTFQCLPQIVGGDVDVLIRESCCWPFETGSDVPNIDIAQEEASLGDAALEVFLKYAFSLPRRPAMHFLSVSTKQGHPDPNAFMSLRFGKKSGLNIYIRRFPINAFDAFAKPFDHFPQREKIRHPKDHPELNCSETDVGRCPIDLERQDGHHKKALFIEKILHEHPEWEGALRGRGNLNLMVNWHPGPLGHEVIGSQIAYYHIKVMEHALQMILNGDLDIIKQYAIPRDLPEPVACSDKLCGPFPSQCAWAHLPKQAGPDIGDIMINDTHHRWRPMFVEKPLNCQSGIKPSSGHIGPFVREAMSCSHLDKKRGIFGGSGDGVLSLKFANMYHCTIIISEAGYGWSKPTHAANWNLELSIKVNGQICKDPECMAVGGTLIIDARALFSNVCRHMVVRVDLEVKPVANLTWDCLPPRCNPSGGWGGYKFCRRSKKGDCIKTDVKRTGQVTTFVVRAVSI